MQSLRRQSHSSEAAKPASGDVRLEGARPVMVRLGSVICTG